MRNSQCFLAFLHPRRTLALKICRSCSPSSRIVCIEDMPCPANACLRIPEFKTIRSYGVPWLSRRVPMRVALPLSIDIQDPLEDPLEFPDVASMKRCPVCFICLIICGTNRTSPLRSSLQHPVVVCIINGPTLVHNTHNYFILFVPQPIERR
jgi:hypothetical protein